MKPKIKIAFALDNINVPVSEASWAECRNGMKPIGGISVWGGSNGMIYLDFVGRKTKQTLRGGASINIEAMDKLATEWLTQRGLLPKVSETMSPRSLSMTSEMC